MNRRAFLTSALKAGAAGLLIPEWLDYKGRSQVAVPAMGHVHVIEGDTLDALMRMAVDLAGFSNMDQAVAVSIIRQGLEGQIEHVCFHPPRNSPNSEDRLKELRGLYRSPITFNEEA